MAYSSPSALNTATGTCARTRVDSPGGRSAKAHTRIMASSVAYSAPCRAIRYSAPRIGGASRVNLDRRQPGSCRGSDRSGDGVETDLELLGRAGPTLLPHSRQLRLQRRRLGDRVRGVAMHLGGQDFLDGYGVHVGQQYLAAGRGVQWCALTDPVATGDRRRSVLLKDVRGLVAVEDGEVDRLAQFRGQLPARRPALGLQLQSSDGCRRQPED